MQILFVIPSITNYFTFLEEFAGKLSSRGHDVHVATSTKQITETNAYKRGMVATLHPIDFPRALNLPAHIRASRMLNKVVLKIKPDIIMVHFSAALFTTSLVKNNNWPTTTGMVHGLGSPTIYGWRKRAISWAENWYAKKMDELYVLNPDDQEVLRSRVPNANVLLVTSYGLGCDQKKFDPKLISEERKQQLRKSLNIDEKDIVYVFIGRQTYFKGFNKVIQAFLKIYPEDKNQKLLLVGNVDNIHSTHLSPEEESILENHPGIINVGWQENVNEYLSISHINVFPSTREGMPVNLMESLSMGVPVITINSRGCKEVVTHNKDGLVLADNTIDEIARAMKKLRENKDLRDLLSANALIDREKFNRDHFIQNQLEIISRLTNLPV